MAPRTDQQATSDNRGLAAAALASLLAFVVMDAAWLSLVAADMFQKQLGAIMRPAPLIGAVVAFYPIYTAGLVALAVKPALAHRSWRLAAVNGAVLGFTAYATFDLSNLAVINGWTLNLAIVDIAWGAFASALAAEVGYAAGCRTAARRSPQS